MKKLRQRYPSLIFIIFIFVLFFVPLEKAMGASATLNPFDPNFSLIACDGPALPAELQAQRPNYIPCDFRGAMLQVNKILSVLIIFGILGAIISFTYAGYLYITGVPGNISRAHTIFKQVIFGFILMLSAWFIVYQILVWVVPDDGIRSILNSK